MIKDICWLDISELSDLIKTKKLSPVELAMSLFERIKIINPKINAYVTLAEDQALATARQAEKRILKGDRLGALCGIPFSVKDVTYTRDVKTTMGSKLFENFIPDSDAIHVARLKRAGAIMLGKTNTPEFACRSMTDNLLFGPTRNPWNLSRAVGGSSGGAAAAVAAGLGPLATGNDAGGSIRIPASCCGVFGLKPQYGRIPCYPLLNLWESMLHEGVITRTVKDAAIMLEIMAGSYWGDRHSFPSTKVGFIKVLNKGVKGLRIAWSSDLGYATVSREVQDICEKAVKKFEDIGAVVEEAKPEIGNPEEICSTIINGELGAMLSQLGTVESLRDKLHPFLLARVEPAQKLTAFDYLKATFARQEMAAKTGRFFKKFHLLLTPTLGVPPWPIEFGSVEKVDGKPVSRLGWHLCFPFNLTGQPAASIPAGWTEDGLPIGLQIIGRYYDEATVLRAAAALEKLNPWSHRRPNLNCGKDV